jgi:hypothetical protein
MTSHEFIKKWRESINYLGLPSVGIHVGWDLIPSDSKVEQLSGKDAWNKIYSFIPSWFKTPKTFRQLVENKDSDYQQIVKEETENGKLEYYRSGGIKEPFFPAFSNEDGSFILLGDGNHRFFDCAHLISAENLDLDSDTSLTNLDIIYLKNFDEVMKVAQIWDSYKAISD